MQAPDLAAQMLETAVKRQGLKGAAVGASLLGDDFANAKFHPVLAKAEELGCVIYIHPQSTPQLAARFKGNGWLSNTIGNPLDTTIALQKLIFEGALDKFPGLKVLAAHGGGYLPSYKMRGDHACFVSPQNCNPNITLKKKPSEYVSQLYFDAMVFSGEGLRHLVSQVGASQLMLGTDHPIPWERHPVEHVMGAPISDEDKVAILGTNAAKLFNIKGNAIDLIACAGRSSLTTTSIDVERRGRVEIIRMRRPDHGNRVSRQMAEEMIAALEAARQSAEVGACVLTGHGDGVLPRRRLSGRRADGCGPPRLCARLHRSGAGDGAARQAADRRGQRQCPCGRLQSRGRLRHGDRRR